MNQLLFISPILFPLLGVLINTMLGRRMSEKAIGWLAAWMVIASFAISLVLFAQLSAAPAEARLTWGAIDLGIPWIQAGALNVSFGFLIDPLSATMMLVVSGVGALIHIYSIGYMHGDPRFARFFVYLNLFVASMMLLVMADSFLLLFVGWELVGLCSYLLIGFWFKNLKNAEAGRKAFVVNRIGDAAFILGILLTFVTFGSLTFRDVFAGVERGGESVQAAVAAITLLLFIGATGKSAQIPLHVWLPDAMAGPTPVSALIHAATMVTAGIYMMARNHVLFEAAPSTQALVAIVGALTALTAGYSALTQFDIKRVLAYSTISQLGFMVAAAGLGAYVAAMFHLVTHAFFKALLFLAAGSVIHALEHHGHHHAVDPQDMRNMGGLRAKLPLTFAVFAIGGLALAGVPPLAGFFSKDEIVLDALKHNPLVFILLTVAAIFTAFYVGRQLMMVFFGRPRSEMAEQAHESPAVMTAPLLALAALTIVGGALNLPGVGTLGYWLAPAVDEFKTHPLDVGLAGAFTLIALGGLAGAGLIYRHAFAAPDQADPLSRLGLLYRLSLNAWYLDRLYQAVVVKGFYTLSSFLASVLDLGGIDGLVNGAGRLARSAGEWLRGAQTGFVRSYGLLMLIGVVVLVTYFLVAGANVR
ncbi:MAG: NADH-quinone oxidoreductase subunit L [Anaerolineae bacterium]|nr:NADH-quinone oxidoreductase subunit L [Thermoflexales bacterium]MDW8407054.1 NADH-quinone oxidoreductase subunit L [Anaerolineae bacterium]